MKQFNTFLKEQKELLVEKFSSASNAGGSKYSIYGGVAGLGHSEPEQSIISPQSSPLSRDIHFYPNTVYQMKSLFNGPKGVANLWTNTITPQESKQLQRVFDRMPDGPQKQKVALMVDDLAKMSFSDDKQDAMDELVAELRKNTFSGTPPTTQYNNYMGNIWDSTRAKSGF